MMQEGLLQALVLGVVQGITEFAPVSSSGHLVVVPWLLGWPAPSLAFDTTLHLGTLLAVLVYFRVDLWRIVKGVLGVGDSDEVATHRRLGLLLVLGTVPAAVIGSVFSDVFERAFKTPAAAGVFFLATAAWLLVAERAGRDRDGHGAEQVGAREAFAIGLAQAAAILPGVSRSGATIGAGMLLGLRREEAARFSFLLAIPIILGAGVVLQVRDLVITPVPGVRIDLMVAGFAAAAASGYLCIRLLLAFLKTRPLTVFAGYVGLMGLLTIGVSVVRGPWGG